MSTAAETPTERRDRRRWAELLAIIAFAFIGAALVGCAYYPRAPVLPPVGSFSVISAPIDVEFDGTTFGALEGEASSHSVLGLFAFGESSVAAAAREGGIETVDHIGHRYLNILFLYSSFTTVVRGH